MLRFTQFIQEALRKEKIVLSPSAKRFIDLWVLGESKALRTLTPTIKEELKNSLSQTSYKLMRTWKFTTQEELEEFFKTPVKKGSKINVGLPSPTSWSKVPKIARSFSNPRIDSFLNTYLSDDELEEREFEEGDLLAISVTGFSSIPKNDLLADLDNIQGIEHHLDEHEVIVDSGVIPITVVEVRDWFFVKDKEDAIAIVDLNANSEDAIEKGRQVETELIDEKIELIKTQLDGGKTPEDILKDIWVDSELIALAMHSGVKNPPLLALIKAKSKDSKLEKTLSYFSLPMMISMIERWK